MENFFYPSESFAIARRLFSPGGALSREEPGEGREGGCGVHGQLGRMHQECHNNRCMKTFELLIHISSILSFVRGKDVKFIFRIDHT